MKEVPVQPIRENYNIPADIILKYNTLKAELEECRSKNSEKKKLFRWTIVCYFLFIAIVLTHWSVNGMSIDFGDVVSLIIASLFLAWIPGMFIANIFMLIFDKLIDLIERKQPVRKETKIELKINELEPIVGAFDKSMRHYSYAMSDYRKMYPGINNMDYDRDKYIKSKENDLLCKFNKEMDYLENIVKKDWWFNLSPLEFENEVAEWYRRQGYNAETTSYVADGGYDIILRKDDKIIYVQCKHYKNKSSIGVSVMRELLGVVTADKVSKGILVCLCKPTQGAMEFAHANGIEIVMVSELASKATPVKFDRTIRYIPNETYIGSLKPYVYIGDIGIIFNVFYYRKDAEEYARLIRSNGAYATYYQMEDLYYIITSNNALLTKMRCYNSNH